jgi:hypothetical protein
MFSRRHEQELLEIKALTADLGERFQEILERLERIRETQDELAAKDASAGTPDTNGDVPAEDGQRGDTTPSEGTGLTKGQKKARREGAATKARSKKRTRKRTAAEATDANGNGPGESGQRDESTPSGQPPRKGQKKRARLESASPKARSKKRTRQRTTADAPAAKARRRKKDKPPRRKSRGTDEE